MSRADDRTLRRRGGVVTAGVLRLSGMGAAEGRELRVAGDGDEGDCEANVGEMLRLELKRLG